MLLKLKVLNVNNIRLLKSIKTPNVNNHSELDNLFNYDIKCIRDGDIGMGPGNKAVVRSVPLP